MPILYSWRYHPPFKAIVYFSDPKNCNEFLAGLRWTDGKVQCPYCGSEKVVYLANVNRYKCYGKHAKAQFSLKVGTILEDSPIGLDKWLCAMWLIVNCKKVISSCEVARILASPRSLHGSWITVLLRPVFRFVEKLSGHVEADETFIGGKARNMHVAQRRRQIAGTGGKDRQLLWESSGGTGGKVRTVVIPNRKRKALQAEVRKHVEAGSALYTDALLSYKGLEADYAHQVVDHAVSFVDGCCAYQHS